MAKTVGVCGGNASGSKARNIFRVGPVASRANDGTRVEDSACAGAHRTSPIRRTVAAFAERRSRSDPTSCPYSEAKTARLGQRSETAATEANRLCNLIRRSQSGPPMCTDAARLYLRRECAALRTRAL